MNQKNTTLSKKPKNSPPQKVWIQLIFDVVLPVLILNKLSPLLGERGALVALILAVSLPLGHGLYDFKKTRKVSPISLLGLINILLTGCFALIELQGIWFAIKEASFPALIGIFVFISSFTKKPLFSFFLQQGGIFNIDQIQNQIEMLNRQSTYKKLVKKCNLFFSLTFFISAVLNFFLAIRIFKNLPLNMSQKERADMINSQIADMTLLGYLVIALPLMVITGCIFYYALKRLSQITKLSINELLN